MTCVTLAPMPPLMTVEPVPVIVTAPALLIGLTDMVSVLPALLMGIALAVVALFIEAIRLFRGWSA